MKSIWIARSKYGYLALFKNKPKKKDSFWDVDSDEDYYPIDNDLFPEVTWENSPIELVPKIMVDENTSIDECINTIFKGKED